MDLDPATTLAQAGPDLSRISDGAPTPPSQNGTSPPSTQDNEPRCALEKTLADLDGGAGAVTCSSGAAAMTTITHLFDADAHILCSDDCRVSTWRLFSQLGEKDTLSVSYEDLSDTEALTNAVQPNTEAVWVATPSSPLLNIADLEVLSAFAEAHELLLIVDNGVLSPVIQRPIEYGADLVVYSTLQHITGHSDAAGGAVIARTEALAAELTSARNAFGTAAPAFDSWLALRGAKTLPVRMQQQEKNARSVVHLLDEHPAVHHVYYPGLREHPGHDIARKQQDGYGGMVSFEGAPGHVDPETILRSTHVFTTTESLGGIESGIQHPTTMSHDALDGSEQVAAGLSDHLFQLSVGIESTSDLIRDLEEALEGAYVADSQRPTPDPIHDRMGARVGV